MDDNYDYRKRNEERRQARQQKNQQIQQNQEGKRQQSGTSQSGQPRRQSKKPSRLPLFLTCAIIICVVLGLASLIFGGKDKTKDPSPPQNQEQQAKEQQLAQDEANGLLILVNKQNPVEQGYKAEDMVEIKYFAEDRPAETRYMREEAANYFHGLVEKAKADGYEIVMTTAYRSYEYQSALYQNAVARKGVEGAEMTNARPGQSEHQTGLAVDISAASNNFQLTEQFGSTPEGIWVNDHAHEYGFIIRYQQGKEDMTGYVYEPWHLRYVGVTAAKEIKESGLALEEYLAQRKSEI